MSNKHRKFKTNYEPGTFARRVQRSNAEVIGVEARLEFHIELFDSEAMFLVTGDVRGPELNIPRCLFKSKIYCSTEVSLEDTYDRIIRWTSVLTDALQGKSVSEAKDFFIITEANDYLSLF